MNIKHYLSAAAAITLFAACSDYDPGMSENVEDYTVEEMRTIKEYEANFIERYGDIDPNHTWGFGAKGSEDEMSTRYSSPNSNMWIKCYKGKVVINGKEEDAVVRIDTEGRKVPGFPVENYYLSSRYNREQDGDPTKPVRYVAPNNPQNSQESTSTPQNLEGWYHCAFPNETETVNGVTRLKEHWFESLDDVISYMQRNNPTKTLYTEVIPLGDVAQFNTLTDAEVADVYAEFSKPWIGTNPVINWDTYFVQQVWKGIAEYTAQNNDGSTTSGIVGGDHMDYLVDDGGFENGNHFYNFNYSDYQLGRKGMMLIEHGNTTNFGYHSSMGSTDWYNHFRLVELHGNYYVGFDFESAGPDNKVARDNIYNDWIIKIVPGNVEETHNWYRIMCEDLGSTYDYDFNDLVYDVYFTGNSTDGYVAHIAVQASGGTLPIYLGVLDDAHETHNMLQNGKAEKISANRYTPVNVGAGVDGVGPYYFVYNMEHKDEKGTDPDYIPIYVTSTDNRATAKNAFVLPTTNKTSKAPQKICIPGNQTKWTKENQQIEWAYPHFDAWVPDQNGEYGFNGSKPWNTYEISPGFLYNK